MKKLLTILISLTLSLSASAKKIRLTGTVVSDNQKFIGTQYIGYIKHVFVDVGDRVEREDKLFELESAQFDIMKSQADTVVEQAKLMADIFQQRLENLQRKKRRLKLSTNKEDLIELEDLVDAIENVQSMLDTAKIGIKEATIKAKQLATIYNYVEMKAPSDGVIIDKRIRVGDMIMPGMLAMILVDTENLKIETEVSESYYRYLRKWQKINITIPSIDYHTVGYVKAIVPSSNPMTHTIKLVINFSKREYDLIPGMYAKLILDLDEEENKIIEKKYQKEKALRGVLNYDDNGTQLTEEEKAREKWDL